MREQAHIRLSGPRGHNTLQGLPRLGSTALGRLDHSCSLVSKYKSAEGNQTPDRPTIWRRKREPDGWFVVGLGHTLVSSTTQGDPGQNPHGRDFCFSFLKEKSV